MAPSTVEADLQVRLGFEHEELTGADETVVPRCTGGTVGKFNPPHLGHLHLIQQAASQVDQLFVLLCDRPDQTLAAKQITDITLDEAA